MEGDAGIYGGEGVWCPADGFNYKLLSHRQTRRWMDKMGGKSRRMINRTGAGVLDGEMGC